TSTTAAKKPTATAKNPGVGEKSHPQPTTSTPGVAATESGTAKQAASTTAAESTASKAGDAAKQAAGTVKSPSVGAKSHPQPTTSSPDVAATESGAAKQATSTTAAKKPAKNPGVGEKTHPQPTTSKPGVAATESGTAKQATSTTAAESTASKAGDAAKKSVGTMKSASARAEHAGAEAAGEQHTMDWNSYFQLRRTRRNYERVFMVPCAVVGLGGAGYYFANKDFDPTPIFGMDQVLVYAAGTVAAGIVGLAMGPVVGNMVFRTTHSKAKPLVDRMDTEFYKHIVRNRADPTANSVRNPVPDYYGEKIKSVSEYRKWLRKQREYRRKATFFVGVD
ncbi:TIM23 complex component, partial [Mortierella polycephala]